MGRRKDALEHLQLAWENGFTPLAVGCPVIIADGLRGTDDVAVALPDGQYVKEAYVARAIADADVLVSLTHFKCHEMAGIGGALKNLGMGCGSRRGKKAMHTSVQPEIDASLCVGCGRCVRTCAHGACVLAPRGRKRVARIDPARCVGCGRCIGACGRDAVTSDFGEPCTEMQGRIAEYAAAAVRGRQAFHVSFACDVSPHCDCHGMNDVPLVPDLGMAASRDPVALDQACADLCNAAPLMPGCCLEGRDTHGDLFTTMHPATRWREAIAQGVRMKLGVADYALRRI